MPKSERDFLLLVSPPPPSPSFSSLDAAKSAKMGRFDWGREGGRALVRVQSVWGVFGEIVDYLFTDSMLRIHTVVTKFQPNLTARVSSLASMQVHFAKPNAKVSKSSEQACSSGTRECCA